MNRDFEKLKRRFLRNLIVGAAVFGISLGLLTGAAIALVQKLMTVVPNPLLCIGVGAGIAIVGFLLPFLLLYPSERRVAKQLDERLSLPEKVQTMVAFRGEESAMLTAQRMDAEEQLQKAPAKALRPGRLWLHILTPVLAVALLLTSILVPVRSNEPIIPDVPSDSSDEWALTEWHIAALQELIKTVQASRLVEEGKTEVVRSLESLLRDLPNVKSKKQMKEIVIAQMIKIDSVSDEVNTFTKLITSLRNSPNDLVKKLAEAIGVPSAPIVVGKQHELKTAIANADDPKEQVTNLSNALKTAVDGAGTIKTDAFYLSLIALAEELVTFASDAAAFDEAALGLLFEQSAQEIAAALNQQNANRTVTDDTNNQLMRIFGISWNELPQELTVPDDAEAGTTGGAYQEKEEDILHGGGLGGGDVLYGSDDAVYSPTDGTHVKYGDVIDEYDAKKTSELSDRPLSDALRDFIDKYFADLYYNDENED